MIINFGPWRPDQPRYGNTCITATNVIPLDRGYGPFRSPSPSTDALAASCIGAISFRRVNGTRETFVGTQANLYRLNGTSWTDVTNAGGFSNATFWRFAVYGERLIATNGIDNPQKFDLASDSAFSDLSNAPIHRFPMVIRESLIAVDLQDGSGDQVAFSAQNDSETWSSAGGGGAQAFAEGGPVVGGTGGEFGIILQENGVTRMDFVGGDLRFTFDKIEGAVGCIDRASIVRHKNMTFYLSSDGFQMFDGAQSVNVSTDKVTDYFFAQFRGTRVTSTGAERGTSTGETRIISVSGAVQGALDPRNSLVVWSYPTGSARKLIAFNYKTGEWSESDANIDCLHTSFQSDGEKLAGFNADEKLCLFAGEPQTAVISTGELQLFRERGGFVSAVRGLVDAPHDITVGKRSAISDAEVTVSGSSNSNGKVSLRSHGRFHRFSLTPTDSFTEISGIDVEARQSGARV